MKRIYQLTLAACLLSTCLFSISIYGESGVGSSFAQDEEFFIDFDDDFKEAAVDPLASENSKNSVQEEAFTSLESAPELEIINITEAAVPEELPVALQQKATDVLEVKEIQKEARAELARVVPSPIDQLHAETKKVAKSPVQISLKEVFFGAPLIYTALLLMSVVSVFLWLYSLVNLRYSEILSDPLLKKVRDLLHSNRYDEALATCSHQDNFFCKMIASGIATRKAGLQVMTETMKTEGKRATVAFWQKVALLNDIAIIAPMIGLLGTVLGMFYAFYDVNRSKESIATFFDGLGVSVGSTVAGLLVAIMAMIFHSIIKYRLSRILAIAENEAHAFATLIDSKSSSLHN